MLEKCHHFQGFPQAVYTWEDLLPLIWEEDKALMGGGTHKGGGGEGTQTLWGDLTLIDYIIN